MAENHLCGINYFDSSATGTLMVFVFEMMLKDPGDPGSSYLNATINGREAWQGVQCKVNEWLRDHLALDRIMKIGYEDVGFYSGT